MWPHYFDRGVYHRSRIPGTCAHLSIDVNCCLIGPVACMTAVSYTSSLFLCVSTAPTSTVISSSTCLGRGEKERNNHLSRSRVTKLHGICFSSYSYLRQVDVVCGVFPGKYIHIRLWRRSTVPFRYTELCIFFGRCPPPYPHSAIDCYS